MFWSKTIKKIPLYKVNIPEGTSQIVIDVLNTGQIANGNNVTQFEILLQKYLNNPFVTTTSDVSTSLTLCLYMAGVSPGDDVIMSPLVCLATSCPVKNLFANVRWCDIDSMSGNISPESFRKYIKKKTKAIIIYLWAGNPAKLLEIYQIAREHGIIVIEDAGEALGSEYQGHRIGNTGADYTVFSFYPNRHITTIEGSAISCANRNSYEKLCRLKRYGIHQQTFRLSNGEINPSSDIFAAGWNSYLNNIAAGIGILQMENLDNIIKRHMDNGEYYNRALKNIPTITLLDVPQNSRSAYWVYTFLVENRDILLNQLNSLGVAASQVHIRNDNYSCFGVSNSEYSGVNQFTSRCISIPCGWWVTDEERIYIVEQIYACLAMVEKN